MRPCPVCGTMTAPTDEFCGDCGTYLGWNESAPTVSAVEATVAQPRPVQPALPKAPRPVSETAGAEPKVEGPPCPNCGTANPPSRRYCRKCAWPLTEPEQAAQPERRKNRRRGGSGRLARTLVLLGIVVALVIAGFVLRPYGASLVQDILDKTSRPAPIHPMVGLADVFMSSPLRIESAAIDCSSTSLFSHKSAAVNLSSILRSAVEAAANVDPCRAG